MTKIDPRVLKTKRKLKSAFFTLIANGKLNSINVKDLTETAQVTRGTFYLHFKDKETFVKAMMTELVNEFFERSIIERELPDGNIQPRLFLTNVFEYVDERPDFFTVLLKEDDAAEYQRMLSDKLHSYIEVYNETTNQKTDHNIPKPLLMNFMIYGVLGYIDQWLRDGKIYATHYMADNLQKLLDSAVIREADLTGFFVTTEV
ncbi:TetR/AcrR family transcriptional regulator [Vagococcus fessus]|uniref:HTH tetR-type domain-containing protein n=1 Tax=Vagococcus fessus TaxID=120370 RepID=A0A430A821_9ENTE|nr:TetR/AcrR family transcriptional regulator [Vagococcus fessus]RSU03221.1 hypothetical protein CBF31_05750 [Vagococcus fessus]